MCSQRHGFDFGAGFPFGPRGFDWGHRRGRGRRQMFESGEIKFVILRLLKEKPRHGYEVIKEFPFAVGLGVDKKPDLWLIGGGPRQGGQHVAIRARGRAAVRAFHEAALAAGAKDNGPPGVRAIYHPNYFGAFVHDLDGNNLEACCHEPYIE